jgi:hypothetical protein
VGSQLDINKNLRILEARSEKAKKNFLDVSRYGEAAWDSASESVCSG